MRATGDHAKMVELICAERDELRAKVATLERELAAVTAERDALAAALRMERASLDTVRGQRDDAMERVAAVEAERDALGAERAMFCSVVDSLTAERDALLKGETRGEPITVLLRMPPQSGPVYLMLAARRYDAKYDDEHHRYFYEEYTCPTNWFGDVCAIMVGKDSDPHGLFEYVGERDGSPPDDPNEECRTIEEWVDKLAATPPTGTPGDGTR